MFTQNEWFRKSNASILVYRTVRGGKETLILELRKLTQLESNYRWYIR